MDGWEALFDKTCFNNSKNVIKSRVFVHFEKRKNTFKTYVVSETTQLIRREWVISFLTHQHIIDDAVP